MRVLERDTKTKCKIYKSYFYYDKYIESHKLRNKRIYILFIKFNMKKSDLAKIWNLSTARIFSIITKQERMANLHKDYWD